MTAILSRPTIPGFAGEVEQFVSEHGITDAIVRIYEATRQRFAQSPQVRIELSVDPDDSSWVSVFFVVTDWPLALAETHPLKTAWYRETQPLIPFDWAWRIGLRIEWRE